MNKILTGSNNITLRKITDQPHGFDKMYMGKDLIESEFKKKQQISSMKEKLYPQSFIQNTFANDGKGNLLMRQKI